ncbi:Cytidylate kinase [uncultured archaeon]|nr:Cytidylate kinase [uncultured archaeon]
MKIAISSYSGSGATTAVNLLAKKLGLISINYTLRNLAVDLNLDFEDIRIKSEKSPYYDYLLDSKQIELTKQDSWVMGSRLAIWLASNADKKIWLECPIEERARRIAFREKWSFEKALEHTRQRDELNNARYNRLYGIDVTSHDFVDCIVSTLAPPEEVVEKIIACKPRNLKPEIPNINDTISRKLAEFNKTN